MPAPASGAPSARGLEAREPQADAARERTPRRKEQTTASHSQPAAPPPGRRRALARAAALAASAAAALASAAGPGRAADPPYAYGAPQCSAPPSEPAQLALLVRGFCAEQDDDYEAAQALYARVVAEHPGTRSARHAALRLRRLAQLRPASEHAQLTPVVPRLLTAADFEYPQELRQRGVQGSVEVLFDVGEGGRARGAFALESDPPLAFELAAVQALERWSFEPGLPAGEPPGHGRRYALALLYCLEPACFAEREAYFRSSRVRTVKRCADYAPCTRYVAALQERALALWNRLPDSGAGRARVGFRIGATGAPIAVLPTRDAPRIAASCGQALLRARPFEPVPEDLRRLTATPLLMTCDARDR